ncbi:MAG: sel1 repeat family protein [Planctomycetes bacterium]|nr:sel1 repeat family protein [Planctomycetota bacterium]
MAIFRSLVLSFTLGILACPTSFAIAAEPEQLVSEAVGIISENGDMDVALENLLAAAEEGDPDACYYLGVLHANGVGVEQDYAEAANWYQEAVDLGHPRAHRNLGSLYESGEGVEQDFAKAVELYKIATSHFPILQWILLRDMGGFYYGGSFFPGFTPAKEANDAYKASGLDSMWDFYNLGEDLVQDDAMLAERVLSKADNDEPEYQLLYAFYLLRGQGIYQDRSAAIEYLRNAAETGHPIALYYMATSYNYGAFASGRNRGEYLRWLEKAAESGHAGSQNDLGETYEAGWTIRETDYAQMYRWKKAAAENGDPYANLTMAALCLQGLEPGGVEQAKRYYQKSADLGYLAADNIRDRQLASHAALAWTPAESIAAYQSNQYLGAYDYCILETFYHEGVDGVDADPAKAEAMRVSADNALLSEKDPETYGSMRSLDDDEREKYDIAIKKWETEADNAPRNFYHLGQVYYHGRGLRKNLSKAREYFAKGAEKEDALSSVWLGYFYQTGTEVDRNEAMADKYYRTGLKWFDSCRDRLAKRRTVPSIVGYWASDKTNKKNAEDWLNLSFAYFTGDQTATPDFCVAVRCLTIAAIMGNPAAQSTLAGLLLRDAGILNGNADAALVWLRLAGEQDHVGAQIRLGEKLLQSATGDKGEAETWLTRAAEQDSVAAMAALGKMFVDNERCPVDAEKGEYWLNRAAEKKSGAAHFWLGRLYERGIDGVPDYGKALSSYRAAFMFDNKLLDDISRRLVFQPAKDDVFYGIKPHADKKTCEEFQKLIDRGNLSGLYLMAVLSYEGTGVRQNYQEAYSYYERAMERGDLDSMFQLALIHHGIRKGYYKEDYQLAAEYYRELLDEGYKNGTLYNNLGSMYQKGHRVKQNHAEAVKFYRLGADEGSNSAVVNLGYMLVNGTGVTKNMAEGVVLLKDGGARKGDSAALYNAGQIYEKGDGVPQNFAEAITCYELAVTLDNRSVLIESLRRLNKQRDRIESPSVESAAAIQANPQDIVGLWIQYGGGQELATFRITYDEKTNTHQMKYAVPRSAPPLRVTDIKYTGDRLTFYSDWGFVNAFFDLKKVSNDEFVGSAEGQPNRWVRKNRR